jgi:Enoyl-(Acyl carrier protein) reductase
MADWMRSRTPMRRLGELHELVGPLLFLASDASSFVTGSVLTVDGGWSASGGYAQLPQPWDEWSGELSTPIMPADLENIFFYKVGFDWSIIRPVTFAFDILGQYIIDNNRVTVSGTPAGDNLVNASIGFKINPWKNVLVLLNVLIPMNDTGLRANFAPLFGLEVDF